MSAADLEALGLTRTEIEVLTYAAHVKAAYADDVRGYMAGLTKDGLQALKPSWEQRHELKARWQEIEATLRAWAEESE